MSVRVSRAAHGLEWEPSLRIREIAKLVGLAERLVPYIVKELLEAEVLKLEKVRRRNHDRFAGMFPCAMPWKRTPR